MKKLILIFSMILLSSCASIISGTSTMVNISPSETIDGNLVTCCGFANRYKYIKHKLGVCSLKEHSIEEVISYQHSLMVNKDEDVMKLCCNCDLYQMTFKRQKEMSIEGKYLAINEQEFKQHFKVPKDLQSTPNHILLWLYQNNLVTKMKQDGIL